MISGIYAIKSKTTKRLYVGSSVDIRKRWSHHKHFLIRGKHSNRYLQNHVNKYGFGDLEFGVIEETTDFFYKEQFWCDYYQSFDRNCGFNLSKIAATPASVLKNVPRSLKVKHKISAKHGGSSFYCVNDKKVFQTLTEASIYYNIPRTNVRTVLSGLYKSTKGLFFAYFDPRKECKRKKLIINRYILGINGKHECGKRIGVGNKGKKYTPWSQDAKNRKSTLTTRPIKCVNDGKIWTSLKECANFYKLNSSTILKICTKKQKQAYGLVFQHLEVP